MNKEERRTLRSNIVKFFIGSILLGLSFNYLSKHEAEKSTVLSGFKIIYQKVEILLQKTFGKNGDLLERKYAVEKYYKELISLAENKKCIDPNVLKELHEKYQSLVDEKVDTLQDTLSNYTSFIYRVDPLIKIECSE